MNENLIARVAVVVVRQPLDAGIGGEEPRQTGFVEDAAQPNSHAGVHVDHRLHEVVQRKGAVGVAFVHQGKEPHGFLEAQEPLQRQSEQIALVDEDVGAVLDGRGIEARERHLFALVLQPHGKEQELVRGHGSGRHRPLQRAHQERRIREHPHDQPMRRRDFTAAPQPPRGEPLQQVVGDGSAFASRSNAERHHVAVGPNAERNAAGAIAIDVRQQPVQLPPLGHPHTVGLDEPRRRQAVFGQQLNAGQGLHAVHQPTTAVAPQLRRDLH